jgi:hypothetical protein
VSRPAGDFQGSKISKAPSKINALSDEYPSRRSRPAPGSSLDLIQNLVEYARNRRNGPVNDRPIITARLQVCGNAVTIRPGLKQ